MPQDRAPTWPLDHARNVYSQAGEDGVAEAILRELPRRNNWIVEFGAWDGVHLSNSRYFLKDLGFSGVLIEGSAERFADLDALYADRSDVFAVNAFVRTSGTDTLDEIMASTPIPADPDYLSIDIDGNDYHVWKSLQRYRPKLVCIEFNPTVPSEVSWAQPDDFSLKRGAGIRALVELAEAKGYELAAATTANAFFVDAELFPALGISDNSIETLRQDTSYVTHVFTGYDGAVVRLGSDMLPWHGMPMRFAGRQELPAYLRHFPLDYSAPQRVLFYVLAFCRHPRHFLAKVRNRLRRRAESHGGS